MAVRDQPQLRHGLQKIAGRDTSPQRALASGKHPRSLLRPPIEAETPRGQAIKSEPTPADTTSSPLPHSLLQPSLVACVFTPTLSTPKQTLASGRPRPLAPRIDALPGTPYPTPPSAPLYSASMRVQQSKIQKGKTACHAIQGLLIFVAGCITIAIFTKEGTTDGRTRYFFALVSTSS